MVDGSHIMVRCATTFSNDLCCSTQFRWAPRSHTPILYVTKQSTNDFFITHFQKLKLVTAISSAKSRYEMT